jgi:hypothetical protein
MAIRYSPEALSHVANSPYAEKRLKNRSGVLRIDDQPEQSGDLLELIKLAHAAIQANQNAQVHIVEQSCAMNVG